MDKVSICKVPGFVPTGLDDTEWVAYYRPGTGKIIDRQHSSRVCDGEKAIRLTPSVPSTEDGGAQEAHGYWIWPE